ncbi:MAG TPA: hypothetical protein VLG09_00095 [Candidatus Saccharimonadales bacterium]|nr:hypothetical protein [Candidatus Saccharimonadales bacterium]
MPAATVSKEEVRLLAIEYGVREAARRLGLKEDRVRQWSSRYSWFAKPADTQNAIVTTVTKASTIVMDELADNEKETRLSLSRYARRASRDAEEASLREAPYVKQVADVAGKVHKWDQQSPTQVFSLNVLNLSMLDDSDD